MKKIRISCLLLLLAALLVCGCAVAAEEPVGVSIFYKSEEDPLVGAEFQLYQIAQRDAEGQWEAVSPFDDYPIQLDDGWEQLAFTLESYALRDEIEPSHSGLTNSNGFLRLPQRAGDMKHGLYLLLSRPHTQDDKRYTAQPVMLALPYLNTDGVTWRYDVLVNIKSEAEEEPDDPETINRKVLKVWDEKGQTSYRPAEITVELLKDGEVEETVVLNSQNNWRWKWEKLDAQSSWHVVEKPVEGYTVHVEQEGITFVITNTLDLPEITPPPPPEDEPTPPPEDEPTPTPSPSDDPTPTPSPSATPAVTATPTPTPYHTATPKPTQPTLPQTGQLWWPVPALVCGGLLFMILGLLRRRSEDYEED